MKKIEETLKNCWNNHKARSIDNTTIAIDRVDNVMRLILFGNEIARKSLETGSIWFTLAGWNTVTTRSRLNQIIGTGIYNKKRIPHRKDPLMDNGARELNPEEWYRLN